MKRLLILAVLTMISFLIGCSKDNIVDSIPIDQEEEFALPSPAGAPG